MSNQDDVADGLKKAARRIFWEVGRLKKADTPSPKVHYAIITERCRKCTDGVYELLLENGTPTAGHVLKSGYDCNDRCLDKFGGKLLSSRVVTEEEAERFYEARSRA